MCAHPPPPPKFLGLCFQSRTRVFIFSFDSSNEREATKQKQNSKPVNAKLLRAVILGDPPRQLWDAASGPVQFLFLSNLPQSLQTCERVPRFRGAARAPTQPRPRPTRHPGLLIRPGGGASVFPGRAGSGFGVRLSLSPALFLRE